MSSPSAVAATITKLQGSKQVEYDRAQAAAQAEAKREYSVADSGGGRGCPGGSDVGPLYAGGLKFTHLRGKDEFYEVRGSKLALVGEG
jgi:hypothetical protein